MSKYIKTKDLSKMSVGMKYQPFRNIAHKLLCFHKHISGAIL